MLIALQIQIEFIDRGVSAEQNGSKVINSSRFSEQVIEPHMPQ